MALCRAQPHKHSGGGDAGTACSLMALRAMPGVGEQSGAGLPKLSPGTGAQEFVPLVSLFHANICSAISFSGLRPEFMVYPPLEAAGSAPVSNCSRRGLCTSTSAAFNISVFTNSMLSYSVIEVFLDMFYSRTCPMCKRRGLWRQIATAGRVFQLCQTFTSTSIMAFPTLGPWL